MVDAKKKSWVAHLPIVGERLADRLQGVPVVAVVRLNGVIGHSGPVRRGGLTLADQAETIEKAFNLPRVKAVALSINSPGGSPVQSALIAGRIRALAEENEVPVYAFCEDIAASGGYWLACAADEIYADGASIVGSIGVITAGFGFPDLLAKVGVERRVYSAGKRKAQLDPFQPENEDDIRHLKDLQKDLHAQFIGYVRGRRGERLVGDDDSLFSGDFWSGSRALDLGLVDGLIDLRSKMREVYGEKVRLRVISQPRSWLQRRFGMQSQIRRWPDEVVAALDERALWARYGL